MRTITFTRKKNFTGSMIPYFIVVGVNQNEFKAMMKVSGNVVGEYYESIQIIKNGDEVRLTVKDDESSCFIYANTSTGPVLSEVYTIVAGNKDLAYLLETKYSLIKGLKYILTQIV